MTSSSETSSRIHVEHLRTGARGWVIGKALHQLLEILAGEVPVQWLGNAAPVVLEGVERAGDLADGLEVVRLEHLALHLPGLAYVDGAWTASCRNPSSEAGSRGTV